MTKLPKRALLAATLATALVGISATALVQASVVQPASAGTAPTVTVLAQADTPAATPPAPKPKRLTPEQRDQKRAERLAHMQKKMAERQATFKAELQLRPEQEASWNAFLARTQPQAQARAAHPAPREDWSKLTTPQRLDRMQALKAQRDAAMVQRVDAIKSFYGSLDAEQQKVFDSKRLGGFHRAGMRGEQDGKRLHRHHGGMEHHRMHGPV